MKVLHTSDWHIGRALYSRKRYEECEAFLNWLAGLIEREQIDVLLVAGDVFDNSTPSNHAQGLYYRFLCRVAAAAKVVLPGVGAFEECIAELRRRDLVKSVLGAIDSGKPFLGICLGLQLLFDVSYENGRHKGLGVLPGEVVRLLRVARLGSQ